MKHLEAAIIAGSLSLGCQPTIHPQDSARAAKEQNNPCADFALDAERVWTTRDTRTLKLGVGDSEVVTERSVVERIRTKMDHISRDWVMAKESACKDALVRRVIPSHVYSKIAACLDSALVKQRTAITVLTSGTVDVLDADKVFDDIASQVDLCRNEAIYSFYGVPQDVNNTDLTVRAEKASDDATVLLRMSQIDSIERQAGKTRKAGEASNNVRFQVEASVVEAGKYHSTAKFKEADEAARRGLELAKKTHYKFGQANADQILGIIEMELGEYDEALKSNKEALAIYEELLGKEHPMTAHAYYNIGEVYGRKKDYSRALELLEKAKKIQERELPEDSIDTAKTYTALGTVLAQAYSDKDHYELAMQWLKKGLAIKEKVVGTKHPSIGISYNSLGTVSAYADKLDEALEWFNKSTHIHGKIPRDKDPGYGATRANMGYVYYLKGNYDLAERCTLEGVEIGERTLGSNHPSVAKAYFGLGRIHEDQKELEEARKWYEKSMKVRESRLGHEHVDTLESYRALADIDNLMRNYAEALVLWKKIVKARETTLGLDNEETIRGYMSTGIILYNDGKYDEAMSYFKKALPLAEKALGKDNSLTQDLQAGIARIQRKIDAAKKD